MTRGINVVYRIIAAVRIEVKSINAFGVKVVRAIGRNESAPFGIVVACVEIIELGFFGVYTNILASYSLSTRGNLYPATLWQIS